MKSVAEHDVSFEISWPVASTSSLPEEAKPQRPLLGVREVSQGQLLVMLKHSQSSFWHLDPAACDLQQREGHVETPLLNLSHERYCHSSSTVWKSQFCKLDTKRRRPSSPVESHRGYPSHTWCRCGSYILSDYLIFTRSCYKGTDHTIVSTIRSTPSKHLIIYTACTNLGRHVRGPPHRCTVVQHICEIPLVLVRDKCSTNAAIKCKKKSV